MDALKSYYEISPFFFVITATATVLYMTMNLFMVFGGDSNHDFISDSSDHFPSDASFKFFSTQTVLAFFMGFGWAGITSTVKWTLSIWPALVIGSCFGFVLMTFTAVLYSQIRKLNQTSTINLYTALGAKGSVYKQIPSSSEGRGEVQVVVSGNLKVIPAISADEAINSFEEVEVVGVKDKLLIVRKIVKDTSNGESA